MPVDPRNHSLQLSGPYVATALLTRCKKNGSTARPSKCHSPACTLMLLLRLATFPNPIFPEHVHPLIDGLVFHLHPSMRFERNLLRAEHHFGGNAGASEEASGHCSALQTVDAFGVPHEGVVHGFANALDCLVACFIARYGPVVNDAMQPGKMT